MSGRVRNCLSLLSAGACIVAAVICAVSCGEGDRKKNDNSGPLKVIVSPVKTATLERKVSATGEIEARATVDIVSKITDRLVRLRLPGKDEVLEAGAVIEPDPKTGKLPVIAVIEHDGLDTALKQAQAALRVAYANNESAKVRCEDSLRQKKLVEQLYNKDRTATKNELDKAETNYLNCKAQLQLAKAEVERAGAAVESARVRRDEAFIEAPIPGMVVKKYAGADEGNVVGPSKPLVRIASIDTVKVVADDISERWMTRILPGKTRADITVDAIPGRSFVGKVHLVGQHVDPATRTVSVEIRVPNTDRELKPGMSAKVVLLVDQRVAVPVVPESALIREDGGIFVYVVEGTSARRRKVDLGIEEGDMCEVTSGLEPGDLVVVQGHARLKDGQDVLAEQLENRK
jgi:RND family efflux transporter MFP subunit